LKRFTTLQSAHDSEELAPATFRLADRTER